MDLIKERNKRVEWMMQDRFGLFIHWGLYAIPAVTEWKQSYEKIPTEIYTQNYFDDFNPVNYDPKEWALMAKRAGIQYAVLTAKHHEGFCLFDSQFTDFKSTKTKCQRDLVGEFVTAFRSAGIKIGLYYSLFDWNHAHYHHYGDLYHPMRDNIDYKNYTYDFSIYLEYLHHQVQELLTNYGKIDILWFDNSYADMVGEKWEATKLVKMIRSLQPDIIINNRLEVNASAKGSIGGANPTTYCGDFVAAEQIIPPQGIRDDFGNLLPWEASFTINNNWSYVTDPYNYKSAKVLIRKMVECTSKGGNLLLNISPNARGLIPNQSKFLLEKIGEWIKFFGDSIYGCSFCSLAKPEWGYYTQRGNKIYAHVFEQPVGPIPIQITKEKIKKIRNLYDMSEVFIVEPWNTLIFSDYTFINFGTPPQFTFPLANEIDTVLEIELK